MMNNAIHWTIAAVLVSLAGCSMPSGTGDLLPSETKQIVAFSFLGADNSSLDTDATGTISGTEIEVDLPFGKARSGLIASFTSTGANVTVGSVPQKSRITANNFSDPLIYTVEAEDGSLASYTVKVCNTFNDTFERPDLATVGNGWLEIELGSPVKASASISGGKLVLTCGDYSFYPYAGVTRNCTASTNSVTARIVFTMESQAILALYMVNQDILNNYCYYVVGGRMYITRDGTLLDNKAIPDYNGSHPYTLLAVRDGGSLTLDVTDQSTGQTTSMALWDPTHLSFTSLNIYGGQYEGGSTFSTYLEEVEFRTF